MTSDAPIFIGGPDRSGKTLLSAVLGSHPRIAISPVGSNMWPFFYRRFGDLRDDRNLDRCIAAMLRYRHVAFLAPDPEWLRREMRRGDRTYARLFGLVQQQYARRLGKPRWGDQTGLIERWADELFASYPGMRMIHVLRDPRDRYEASLEMWPKGRLRAGGATARWNLSAELAERNLRRFGESRYRVLRYESLVCDPEGTARALCDFLGEEFVPSMLELAAMPGVRAKLEAAGGPRDGEGLISPAFIGRYRGRVPPDELAFLERHTGRWMARLGYEPDPSSRAVRRRPGYWLRTEPSNLARMLAWRWREAAAHSLPRWLGRRIRSGMLR
ncbi:MAG TPA: sulfotransferase [candidate division Zixibacteria bacterium]|nr:sulfotransferase [candidate division Zixibacteria bacterium]